MVYILYVIDIDQLQVGFKIIINAFENKINTFEKELNNLRDIIKNKNQKILEYEGLFEQMDRESKRNEDINCKVINENKYLYDLAEKLREENNKLSRFKNTIVNSVEVDTDSNPNLNYNSNMNSNIHSNTGNVFLSSNNSYIDKIKSNKTSLVNSPISNYNSSNNDNIDCLINKLNINILDLSERDDHRINKSNKSMNIEDKILDMKRRLKKGDTRGGVNNKIHANTYRGDKKQNSYYIEHDNNNNLDTDRDIDPSKRLENKSNQYILSSKFFNECKIVLKREEYDVLIDIIKQCNVNKLDKKETIKRVHDLLVNYPRLYQDFKLIFKD